MELQLGIPEVAIYLVSISASLSNYVLYRHVQEGFAGEGILLHGRQHHMLVFMADLQFEDI